MKTGDIYYSPSKNELVEINSIFEFFIDELWLTYNNTMIKLPNPYMSIPGSNRFPFEQVKEFKKTYRKIGNVYE